MQEAESTRRAAAEARRQKILQRGKDRLAAITGTPSNRSDEISTPVTVAGQAQATSPETAPDQQTVPSLEPLPQAAPASTSQKPLQEPVEVQTPSHASPKPLSAPQPQRMASGSMGLGTSSSSDDLGISSEPGPAIFAGPPTSNQLLHAAVRSTQLARMLLAMLLAWALIHGGLHVAALPAHPHLLLAATQVALIIGARMVVSVPAARRALGIRASSPQGPLAAKGFNLMSLVNLAVPGSTNMLGQVSAMMQVVTSVGDMSAVFIVTYATLQAVAGAKAAASS